MNKRSKGKILPFFLACLFTGQSVGFLISPAYCQPEAESYGKKDGLKNLDQGRIRIDRPAYESSDTMPPLAPDIVKRDKAAPPVAPAPSGGPDSSTDSKSTQTPEQESSTDTRIPRPANSQSSPQSKPVQTNKKEAPNKTPTQLKKGAPDHTSDTGLKLIEQVPRFAEGESEKKSPPSSDKPSSVDQYPVVGKLENLTFGKASPERDVAARLASLENSIFAREYSDDSLFDRTERLKRTLLGTDSMDSMTADNLDGYDPYSVSSMAAPLTGSQGSEADFVYLDELAKNPENFAEQPKNVVNAYALELINFERRKRSLRPLETDKLIQDMADQQMIEMLELRQLSHSDQYGQNPDRRYTLMGGVDAVTEGLVAVSTADLNSSKLTKSAVCVLLKTMLLRQDDREALLSPEATHLATSFGTGKNGTKIFGCTEVLTRRAKIEKIDTSRKLGDKVTVKGEIFRPYSFDKITVAWEEALDSPIEEEPGSNEALPYFPPLDYVAYDTRAERDHSKAITALKALGVMAAIAGGMFVPPVALAAPLIVMAGPGAGEMRPQSDIPVKGGVKLSGSSFKVHIPLDNEDQEGLYYITVWASLGDGTRPVAISRRAIMVKKDIDDDDHETNPKKEPSQVKSDPTQYTKGSDLEKDRSKLEDSEEADKHDDDKDDDSGI